ncbi:hypothetical protein LWI29_020295 [Acer saccharum]|uniref:Uncharacterized protein n=1 Tax=Acer saccharum TaxID=4024 RepID=A0AA39RQA7_ACESA|nr:hypothetical protein LWI29_020295 [Acer saccharum]
MHNCEADRETCLLETGAVGETGLSEKADGGIFVDKAKGEVDGENAYWRRGLLMRQLLSRFLFSSSLCIRFELSKEYRTLDLDSLGILDAYEPACFHYRNEILD